MPGHILPETRTITPPSPSPTVKHPFTPPPHTHWIECTCTLQCYSMILCKWHHNSTALTTVHTYMVVGTMYNSEDTCKTMTLQVRVSSDDHNVQYYSKLNICLRMYMYRSTYTVADNKTYKESMQDRTKMAKDRTGSTGQLWLVLQMVHCRLLSKVSLTSVLSRSIPVSSPIGCESIERGAPPDEGSPVCEGNRQGQNKES